MSLSMSVFSLWSCPELGLFDLIRFSSELLGFGFKVSSGSGPQQLLGCAWMLLHVLGHVSVRDDVLSGAWCFKFSSEPLGLGLGV